MPGKLIKENPYHGIYYVQNRELFPIQIVVTKELDGDSHTWLKSLSNTLEKAEMRELLERIEGLTQTLDRGACRRGAGGKHPGKSGDCE